MAQSYLQAAYTYTLTTENNESQKKNGLVFISLPFIPLRTSSSESAFLAQIKHFTNSSFTYVFITIFIYDCFILPLPQIPTFAGSVLRHSLPLVKAPVEAHVIKITQKRLSGAQFRLVYQIGSNRLTKTK